MNIKIFLKENWVSIVATIALIQPWLLWLYKRFFKREKIIIYPSGHIEIGYFDLGPTLTIQGTLKAENRDVFIRDIRLKIKKIKNNEQHWFYWAAFGSPKINIGQQSDVALEYPASFIVKKEQPHRFLIAFSDVQTQEEMKPLLDDCIKTLGLLVKDELQRLVSGSDMLNLGAKYTEKYRKSDAYSKAFDRLNRNLYWESGDYELEIIVNSERRSYVAKYKFSLTADDFELLKNNVITMIENPLRRYLGVQTWVYQFAYAQYKI
jgi:hypothetical protein